MATYVRYMDMGEEKYGIVDGGTVYGLEGHLFTGTRPDGSEWSLKDVHLMAPCLPSKVVCAGLNYRDHAAELGLKVPDEPVIFLKPATAVIGPGDAIVYPQGLTERIDFEGELAIVIGRRARFVAPEEAHRCIFGYTIANDVTARDLQQKDGQWTRAKGFDTFCPIGPAIVSDLDTRDLAIETYLDGVCKQRSSTSQLIWRPEELVSFISAVMTLLPGDIVLTGTPAGIGPMQPGDTVRIYIEGIGDLENPVLLEGE